MGDFVSLKLSTNGILYPENHAVIQGIRPIRRIKKGPEAGGVRKESNNRVV
jgi:hypothetical protein